MPGKFTYIDLYALLLPDADTGEIVSPLAAFLTHAALEAGDNQAQAGEDAVQMMTIHSAKGLEFPVVFLPGMEDGIFPGMQSIADASEMEEERRLAYVAITRAKEELYIFRARERITYGKTQYNPASQFLKEIPESLCVTVGDRRPGTAPAQRPAQKPAFRADSYATKYGGIPKKTAAPAAVLSAGDRVRHPMFGEGLILSASKMGADTLYEVAFDTVGTKKLMATFAKLTKI